MRARDRRLHRRNQLAIYAQQRFGRILAYELPCRVSALKRRKQAREHAGLRKIPHALDQFDLPANDLGVRFIEL